MRWTSHSTRSGSRPMTNWASSCSTIVWIAGSVGPEHSQIPTRPSSVCSSTIRPDAVCRVPPAHFRGSRIGTSTAVVWTDVTRNDPTSLEWNLHDCQLFGYCQQLPVELDAAKRGPRHHVVVEALRDEIVSGRLAPGERLIEERLSTELGTTRGAVREALRRLEHEGLVMSFPYRGSVVLGVSEEEVHEVLMPIRVTLERYCFSKALPLLSRDDFAE